MNFVEQLQVVKNWKKENRQEEKISAEEKLHLKFSLLWKISRSSGAPDTSTKRICLLMNVSHRDFNGIFSVTTAISFCFQGEMHV